MNRQCNGANVQYFLTKNLTVRKLSEYDTNRFSHSATGTVYKANLQNPTPEEMDFYQGNAGMMFVCFVDIACPAEISDKVIIDNITYKVKGVKEQTFGSFQFIKLILVKE